jgi:hypothetical protein
MICESNFCQLDPRSQVVVSARNEVQRMLGAKNLPTKACLLLTEHYPFFGEQVQAVLMERHPESPAKAPLGYAVDAYLWAEQYGWISYENSPIRSPVLFEEFASFYFTTDLHWYSRLLTAIAERIELMLSNSQDGPREVVLQAWHNRFTSDGKIPSQWLEGTKAIEHAKKMVQESASAKDPRDSWRVSAARINRRRRSILELWLPGWRAELEFLDQILGSTAGESCH